ncbi:hypothetical protein BREVNS_0515 [Brevinematales bacterium NS]|nr:hypothetical protein BREVNS_0515 [Brevinematales bacterium NS]
MRQKTHDRKSGPVDTERSRSGVQKKKGVKEQSFLVLFPCSLRNVEIGIQFHMWNDKGHIFFSLRKILSVDFFFFWHYNETRKES